MEVISVFAVIAAIVLVGYLSEEIFKRTNIPDVLILIFLGIIIGTILQWASAEQFGDGSKLFTTFALVFILFQGALNIEFKTLLQSLFNTSKLTILSFILTVGIITLLSYVFIAQNWMLSLLIGMILGGTSSAVVIPLVSNVKMSKKNGLVLTLESAISDVLCIVGAITIISVYETQLLVASGIFNRVLTSFALALLVGVVIGFVWIILLNKFDSLNRNNMVGIAVVIALYAFVESSWVNASGAIAALSFGLVWGNASPVLRLMHEKKKREDKGDGSELDGVPLKNVLDPSARNFFTEIGFFVKVFFFVYLGILIDFSNPWPFLFGALLTVGIFLVRPLAVKLAFWGENQTAKERTMLEILIPKGLAAAVLVQLAVQSEFPGAGEVVNTVLSVVLLSIIMTGILTFLTQKGWFTGFYALFRKLNPLSVNSGKPDSKE